MNIRLSCSGARPGKRCYGWPLAPALAILAASGGCYYSGGELLFLLGLGRGQKIEAKFRLTEGPVLLLIDDAAQLVDVPDAKRHLFDKLAAELLANKAAHKIIPRQTIDQLKQSMPDFDKRGCREIGAAAGAEQVLWVEVRDFLAEPQIEEVVAAARFRVAVKVINAQETKSRSRVRLWPQSPEGHQVLVTMAGSEVSIAQTKEAVAKELATRLAVEIAKLFYDHRLGDFEREP